MRADDTQEADAAGKALVEITPHVARAYLAMVDEFEAAGGGYPFNDTELARRDLVACADDLRNEALGIGLPPDVASQTTYILMDGDGRALGKIRCRPRLTPPFERHNGHIDYNVRLSERGKGYAARMLALQKARALGLERVLLLVAGENPASVRVIEKNGGILERRYTDDTSEMVAIYWIAR